MHAFPLSGALWEGEIQALRAAGFRAIAPDQRGFGGSPLAPDDDSPTTMETLADDALAVLDARGIDRAVMVGLSMGGYALLSLYERAPERMRALVLADSRYTADSEDQKAGRERLARALLEHGMELLLRELVFPSLLSPSATEATRERVAAIVRDNLPSGSAAALRGMALRRDHEATCRRIRVPTLVLVGSEDTVTPPSSARALAAAIPDARLSELPGAGHLANLEAPVSFQGALISFLRGLP